MKLSRLVGSAGLFLLVPTLVACGDDTGDSGDSTTQEIVAVDSTTTTPAPAFPVTVGELTLESERSASCRCRRRPPRCCLPSEPATKWWRSTTSPIIRQKRRRWRRSTLPAQRRGHLWSLARPRHHQLRPGQPGRAAERVVDSGVRGVCSVESRRRL